jgi:hypothetical protein
VLGLLVAVAHLVTLMLMLWGLVFLVPWVLDAGRWVVTRRRQLAGVPLPYQPEPPAPDDPRQRGLSARSAILPRTEGAWAAGTKSSCAITTTVVAW